VFDKEHWIYWAGPAIGAILAVLFYKFIKILEYEVANPGQDDDDKDAEDKEKEGDGEVQQGQHGQQV
jgi:aquaporin related protein